MMKTKIPTMTRTHPNLDPLIRSCYTYYLFSTYYLLLQIAKVVHHVLTRSFNTNCSRLWPHKLEKKWREKLLLKISFLLVQIYDAFLFVVLLFSAVFLVNVTVLATVLSFGSFISHRRWPCCCRPTCPPAFGSGVRADATRF